ncbi:MAG: RsmB/NOP family class I SAM-dependent RNA methyltransferase [Rhodothermales bacterium]
MIHDKSTTSLNFFSRYESIIDDWDAFEAYSQKPLPATIWTNTLKTTSSRLATKIPLKPLEWYPGAFLFPKDLKPATLLPYVAGHYQIQEEAALLPIHLMNPQPGETILDMCAAPGNKTVQMAVAMQSTGVVVANDRSRARLSILRRSVSRLGLTNVAMTVYDATSLQGEPESYDKILADVPCSGEGTVRRHKKKTQFISTRRRDHIQNIQLAILNKAVSLCKTGGRIVYSTCTFAPEENEAVLNKMLLQHEGRVSVIPAHVQGFKTMPGLTSWEGETFEEEISHAHRVWPHHNDTGGFFVAVIEKNATTKAPSRKIVASPLEVLPSDGISRVFCDRFGLSKEVFEQFSLQQYGKFLSIRSFDILPANTPTPLQAGLPFCRPEGTSQKMKTGAAMKWGETAAKNQIELTLDQAYFYGNGETIAFKAELLEKTTTPGYVLIKHQDMHLGLGFLRIENGIASIESLLPKQWVHTLNKH